MGLPFGGSMELNGISGFSGVSGVSRIGFRSVLGLFGARMPSVRENQAD